MKKYLVIYIFFFLLIFLLPAVFTKKNVKTDSEIDMQNKEETSDNYGASEDKKGKEDIDNLGNQYDYKDYSDIRLLHCSTGEIETVMLDTYLQGVVSAEMPASFEQEALNAQAVVARTYTIYTISHNNGKHEGADICDDSNCCQAWISKDNRLEKWDEQNRVEYWNKIISALENTKGKIITYNGEPIDAFFHSNSGGSTEIPVNVWGGTDFPYLQTVETSGEEAYSQYSSEVVIEKEELTNKIKEKYPNFEIDYSREDCIKVLEYTESNRVKTIQIGNIRFSGVEIRSLVGLKSTNFEIKMEENNVYFTVRGYGHGVGMSQTGADSMAKQGNNYVDIIKHFYSGVEVVDF